MFIESLSIRKNDQTIREIKFHKGVNLIIDKSTLISPEQTGNNVGKTTVLRLIDFCLGGKADKIYQDPEFNKQHKEPNKIKKFLIDNQILIELILTRDLSLPNSEKIVIARNFLSRSQKIQTINGKPFKEQDFSTRLSELIFQTRLTKPSFRHVICRNIRHSTEALNHTVKPLHQATKNTVYEALYLYWLGIPVHNTSKGDFTDQLNTEKSHSRYIENTQMSLSQANQGIYILQEDIKVLEEKKAKFNLNENYAQDLNSLNRIKKEINTLKTEIVSLNMRKNLIMESQRELESTEPKIETEKVKYIYTEAKSLMPNLQKKFTDIITFHRQMIEEKKKFITQELPEIDSNLRKLEIQQEDLLKQQHSLVQNLEKTGGIEELEQIIVELTKKYEEKGQREKVSEILKKSEHIIKDLQEEIDTINKELEGHEQNIENNIRRFNHYFSAISSQLYGEKFLISYVRDKHKNIQLNISSLGENPGTGRKRSEIIAFDLAYIQFSEELKILHLNFILHDQLENIHDNQIDTIFLNVVQGINCQYIVPILHDKLPPSIDAAQYAVLSLSEDDKLFKLP